jgi:hypothetical protein
MASNMVPPLTAGKMMINPMIAPFISFTLASGKVSLKIFTGKLLPTVLNSSIFTEYDK